MIQVIKDQDREYEVTIYDQVPLKDENKPFFYCIVICISTIYSGYCLTVISAATLVQLKNNYNIELSDQSTLSLLNGILPAGGMLGSILVPNIIPLTTKKKAVYFLALASWIVCGLSIVPHLLVLVMSRFLLGILNGLHMSLAASFIKQTFPAHIRKPLGAVYSTCRIFGMLICYLIAQISSYNFGQTEHILILMGPAILGTVQSILFFIMMPDSIVQAITKMSEQHAKKCLAVFYDQQNINTRYDQMRKEIAMAVKRTMTYKRIKMANRKNFASLHLAMLRQFCGQTYIVIYARVVMKFLNSPYADMAPAIINGIQLLAGIIGIYTVQKFDRFRLIVANCAILSALNVAIGLTDMYEMPVYCLASMTAFMLPNGIGLSSVAWCYPSELVAPSQGKYSSLLNWTCSTMVAMIPPYVVAATGDNAYPIFFFFALYLIVAQLINFKVLPRTDRLRKTGSLTNSNRTYTVGRSEQSSMESSKSRGLLTHEPSNTQTYRSIKTKY